MPERPEGVRADAAPVAAAVLAALLLRAAFFSALTGYDEFAYARIAQDITDGAFRLRDASGYYGFRYLVTLPAALAHAIFGQGKVAAAAWPLLCSLGNTVLAYLLGREFFGRRAGVLAAFLQAFLPVSAIFGTMLYPEEILVFWTGLSALLFIRGSRRGGRWGGAGLLALSGLCAGLGWHTRMNSAVMLGVYAVWGFSYGLKPAHLALFGGLAAALAPDWLAGAALAGDPLFSLRSQFAKLAADTGVYPVGHAVYLRGLLGLDLYGLALYGLYFYVFAAAAAAAVFMKQFRGIWVPFAWFAVMLLYFEFGPASLQPYQPVHKQLRFLSMAFFPVIIIAANFVSGFKPAARTAAMALLLSTSAFGAWKMGAYRAAEAAPLAQAADFMAAHSPSAVYADGAWANSAGYYLRGLHGEPYYRVAVRQEGFVRPLNGISLAKNISGACAVAGASGAALSPLLAGLKSDVLEIPGQAVVYCFK